MDFGIFLGISSSICLVICICRYLLLFVERPFRVAMLIMVPMAPFLKLCFAALQCFELFKKIMFMNKIV